METASRASWVEVVHYFEGGIVQSNPPTVKASRLRDAVISSHVFTFQLPTCRGSSGGTKSHDPRRGFAFSIRALLLSRLATTLPQSRQKESQQRGQELPNQSPRIRNKSMRPWCGSFYGVQSHENFRSRKSFIVPVKVARFLDL